MIYYVIFGLILFIFCFVMCIIDKKDKSIRAAEKDEFYTLLRNIDKNVVDCNYLLRKIREQKDD